MTLVIDHDQDEAGLDRLLDAIFRQYHYDFRHHARPVLHRRIARARSVLGGVTLVQLLDRVVREPEVFTQLLGWLTIQVSELFRDPGYFRVLRDEVLPYLATHPSPRIWVAGCGTGEEAYSIAILLHEAGLLDRSLVYATDVDAESLRSAAEGSYEVDRVRRFSESYFRAGGRGSLSDHYAAAYSHAAFLPRLRDRILFTDHCLATDSAFAEVHLVSCRNVMIYFDRELQDRAVGLFRESLSPRGFLGLGMKETLVCSKHAGAFEVAARAERIYRLR